LGGLPKKALQISVRGKEVGGPTLLVDAGNLLFKQADKATGRERMTAAAIAAISRQMNYDAVAVGPLDLAAGKEFLIGEGALPWLSANLRDHDNKPLFPGEAIVNRDGLTIGIIGVSGGIDTRDQSYQLVDWREILPNTLARLQSSCDLLVVLSTLSAADNRDLLRLFPEVHVLLTADRQKGNVAPTYDNRTVTAQAANRGQYLGILDLSWVPAKGKTDRSPDPSRVLLGNDTGQVWATFGGQALPLTRNLPEDPLIGALVKEADGRIRQQRE
jgi:2',3'-cyclic-nucleotide 2'-phosphodiesterase (5'-nucleotidase family)